MLGNIRLIGELYKKKMLTERVMHTCINKLLGQNEDPAEEDIESLCILMSTIGEIIDHPKAKEHMDAYFDIMGNLSNDMRLSFRVRFMLKDVIDLRRNKWPQRRKDEGTEKIDEVHRDLAIKQKAQASRLQSRPNDLPGEATCGSAKAVTGKDHDPTIFSTGSSRVLGRSGNKQKNFSAEAPGDGGAVKQTQSSSTQKVYRAVPTNRMSIFMHGIQDGGQISEQKDLPGEATSSTTGKSLPGEATSSTTGSTQVSVSELDFKDKPSIELSNLHKSKKKRKELRQRANEKKDGTITPATMPVNIDLKHVSTDAVTMKEDVASDPFAHSKAEPDDGEDAADMSTQNLDTSNSGDLAICALKSVNENVTKKFSQDFLKYKDHCTDMTEGLDTTPEVEALIDHSRPSPGIVVDRSSGPSRPDRRVNVVEEDKWNKVPEHFVPGQDLLPLQVMHRADKKYEIGQVSDEEEAKQRQLKAILNKLHPHNFAKLVEQVKAVNIDNAVTLSGLISQTFDKALTEPTSCEMYANFCHHLAGALPDFREDNEKITFKRLLLNKCQEEFERGELEQEEANRVEEGEIKQSKEEREDKRVQARWRMLGNITLIGELYKKKMLTERVMHSCINKLLGQNEDPDVEDIESLCILMSTIGEMIDHPKAKEHMDAYFDIMGNLSNNRRLSFRVRFMLKDVIDLRRNKWPQRRKDEGTKKIDEVHRDLAIKQKAQASRLQSKPNDLDQRNSPMLSSLNSQMGKFSGYPPQLRGYGNQGGRSDERQSYEARHMFVSLPQRPVGDDSITLGPQGGLARGMWNRGQQANPSVSAAELSPGHGDFRRMPGGVNGYNASTTPYGSKEHYMPWGNRAGHSFEGPLATSLSPRMQEPANNLSETALPEDRLHEKSITEIKEYYSEWIDPPLCERERSNQIILELLRKINDMEKCIQEIRENAKKKEMKILNAMEKCTQEIRENAKKKEMKIWSLFAISWFIIVFLLMLLCFLLM